VTGFVLGYVFPVLFWLSILRPGNVTTE